jgi:hypothetical protein
MAPDNYGSGKYSTGKYSRMTKAQWALVILLLCVATVPGYRGYRATWAPRSSASDSRWVLTLAPCR